MPGLPEEAVHNLEISKIITELNIKQSTENAENEFNKIRFGGSFPCIAISEADVEIFKIQVTTPRQPEERTLCVQFLQNQWKAKPVMIPERD